MAEEIAPCPHCGSKAELHTVPEDQGELAGGRYIECGNTRCGASSALMFFERPEDAEKALTTRWNRRSGPRLPSPEPAPEVEPPQFPTSLRKQWSGAEVQAWINEHWSK